MRHPLRAPLTWLLFATAACSLACSGIIDQVQQATKTPDAVPSAAAPAPGPGAGSRPHGQRPHPGAAGSFEIDVDRFGGDYRDFDITGEAAACQAACDAETECRAWTYFRGQAGAPNHCWLKNEVPEAAASPGYVSGVKAAAP